MTYIDLTHLFTKDMPVYPGDPNAELKQTAFFEKDGFNDFRIETNMHVGTHIDAPLHMIAGGKKICEYPPEKFIGRGHVIDVRGKEIIGPEVLVDVSIAPGDIILFRSDFDKQYGDEAYFTKYPEISRALAELLIERGVGMIGLDWASPDRMPYDTHKLLLGKDILIIENLTNFEKLPAQSPFRVLAFPLRLDTEAAPARVIAEIL
ncbi:MAG: cyclase family protein [Patescibacteria group bacterium]